MRNYTAPLLCPLLYTQWEFAARASTAIPLYIHITRWAPLVAQAICRVLATANSLQSGTQSPATKDQLFYFDSHQYLYIRYALQTHASKPASVQAAIVFLIIFVSINMLIMIIAA